MQIARWALAGTLGLVAFGAVGFGTKGGCPCCTTASARENVGTAGTVGPAAIAGSNTATLSIEGTTCAGCAIGIRRALKDISGVSDVKMLEKGAVVQYDPTKAKPAHMVAAVNKLGYKATVVSDVKG